MSLSGNTFATKPACGVRLFDADGGPVKGMARVVLILENGKQGPPAQYDSTRDTYVFPFLPGKYVSIEVTHPLYEPGGISCAVSDSISIYLFKKDQAYIGDISGKTYYTRYPDRLFIEFNQALLSAEVVSLLEDLGLEGKYDSLFGEDTYYRKDGKPFARYQSHEITALRKSPLVTSVSCVLREKDYVFFVPPHDPGMLAYATDVKKRKNPLFIRNKIMLVYSPRLPQRVLDSLLSAYQLKKSPVQDTEDCLSNGTTIICLYLCSETVGEGVLDIAAALNHSGILNAYVKWDIKMTVSGFPLRQRTGSNSLRPDDIRKIPPEK